jgi:hypothetical protein
LFTCTRFNRRSKYLGVLPTALLGGETVLLPDGAAAARPFDAEYDGLGHSIEAAKRAASPDSKTVFLMALPPVSVSPGGTMQPLRRINRTVVSIARRQRALRAPPVLPLGVGEPGELALRTVITPFLI